MSRRLNGPEPKTEHATRSAAAWSNAVASIVERSAMGGKLERVKLNEPELEEDERLTLGRKAWMRLTTTTSFADWLLVGEALEIGRVNAAPVHFRRRKGKVPNRGRAFNAAFGKWLKDNGFAGIDAATRSRLSEVMKNRAAIEKWYSDLPPSRRLTFSYPGTVLRKWRASTQTDTERQGPPKRGEVSELREKVKALAAKRLDEINRGRDGPYVLIDRDAGIGVIAELLANAFIVRDGRQIRECWAEIDDSKPTLQPRRDTSRKPKPKFRTDVVQPANGGAHATAD